MPKVIERHRARYDAQEVAFGTVYKWHPESVLIECECGETVALTAYKAACEECGTQGEGAPLYRSIYALSPLSFRE